MTMKIGDGVALRLNGISFALARDVEPIVFSSTKGITEIQAYGDGTADGYISVMIPKITGLKCKISEENKDAFENAKANPSMPIILECVSKSFELTGCIVGDFGKSATKSVTDEFEVHATDGGGIRES